MGPLRLTGIGLVMALALAIGSPYGRGQAQVAPDGGWGTTVTPRAENPRKRAPRDAAKLAAPAGPAVPSPGEVVATGTALSGDSQATRLAFDLSAPVSFSIFRMASPFRVVLDLDGLVFRLPAGTGRDGRGLVTAFRFGLFAPGKARIVIDTAGPTRVESARIIPQPSGAARLEIALAPTTATELAAAELASAVQSIEMKPRDEAPPPAAERPRDRARPVIVIDPGHGGIDPGAQGAQWLEKDLVLAVARQIRRSLVATRRYDVEMTRSSDVFVSLDQRVRFSRRHHADLFISIHADALAQRDLAQSVRGATVYTLSESASDDRARQLAEKENAADLLAGVAPASGAGDDQVRNILFDLMRRETSNLATDFRSLLVGELRPRLAMAKEPMRSAPFKVLRQPGSPAVLIELGYISNIEDERQMGSEAWQRGVGEAVARAVEAYLARRTVARE